MSEIKPWQIIVIFAAIVVLAFSGWRMMGADRVVSPSGHMTVDVMTGQLYLVKKGKAKGIMYPAKHPDTGDRTLFPVSMPDGSERWDLDGRFLDRISDSMREGSSALVSGVKINVQSSDPIVFVLKK